VLEGDESRAAASDLEAAIVDEYLGDDRFGEVLDALALDAPGSGMPYYNAPDLRAVIRNLVRELPGTHTGSIQGKDRGAGGTSRWERSARGNGTTRVTRIPMVRPHK